MSWWQGVRKNKNRETKGGETWGEFVWKQINVWAVKKLLDISNVGSIMNISEAKTLRSEICEASFFSG